MLFEILLRGGNRIKVYIITRDRGSQKTPIIGVQIPTIRLYHKLLNGILRNQLLVLLSIEIQTDKFVRNR